MNRYGRKGDPRKRSNAEAIIDAGNAAYQHGVEACSFARLGDAESARDEARAAATAGIRAMLLVRPIPCCDATHYLGERCSTISAASISQIEVRS